ncbi:Calx-beta domain-containing protein, partial [Vibrio amylolyticus]|uniref:Calx-beta domain-containing protein n=1 Tax=Vibrio amylolyticus TaxID=2847292 RepID=UPI00354F2E7D
PNGEWQDYDEVNGFQTPDSGVVKVRVEVLDDNETETRESVIVTATTDSNHVNAQSASAQGIIKDDLVEREDGSKVDEDAPDIVVTGGDNLTESDDAYLTYEVKLSGPAANDVDVVLTLGGDATVGSDYENKVEYFNGSIWETYNGSLTLPADAEGVQVRIAVIDDLETEEVEGVSLTATTTDNNVAGQSASDTVYIFDDRSNSKPDYDEDIPDLTVTGAGTVSEGDIATFTVNLSKPIDEIVTLDVRTKVSGSSNTAEADDIGDLEVYYFKDGDKTYLELDGNLVSIPANVQDIYVEVPTVDDNGAPVFEGPEQFQLVVRDINSVTTDSNGKATAEATIDDSGAASGDTPDDDRPIVESISNVQVEEGNTATFTVELSNESTTQTLVRLKYTDSSATAPEDYGS